MLIDATHAEETRVVVVNGTRLEDFDVETSTKKQLKGNIYLAKIVRVEPSLQAAFVEYGGGRHGFLAFNEIHPDYYQIPVADRQALIAQQRAALSESPTLASADFGDGDDDEAPAAAAPMDVDDAAPPGEDAAAGQAPADHDQADAAQPETAQFEGELVAYEPTDEQPAAPEPAEGEEVISAETESAAAPAAPVERAATDEPEEVERRQPRSFRHYKIQEVIKRRQIVLVQVVKEERGNKGAALTTFLSLAGRYCVLMPNTARGGGVSRKITSAVDRKRLKSIVSDLDIPDGMAVIVRTAGSERTKPEIRRDYDYLLRLWDSVRDLTLRSSAPTLVYEEANLIKRSIRDLYSRDIEEVLVEGDEGYRLAKDFMRMLTPSHARKVQLFRDPSVPLFQKYQVETQLDAMHSPVVQLRSGGYLVINQTEALVAIDVNSGRSTRERHIEETALKTNCEAADEVARQLRLRDLAGLIVIDFIDMEESRNNYTVERRLKEAMRFDRARIQVGRISSFGLLELSRQRLRPSLQETSFQPCVHCNGTGQVRSVESASVHVLRAIEEEGIRRRSSEVTVTVHPSIALYILNQKRTALGEIEARYGFRVFLAGDDSLVPPGFRMERVKSESLPELPTVRPILAEEYGAEEEDEVVEASAETPEPAVAATPSERPAASAEAATDDSDGARRRRRRRRRRGRRDDVNAPTVTEPTEPTEPTEADGDVAADAESEAAPTESETEIAVADGDPAARRRRRGRRGGRRRGRRADGTLIEGAVTGEGGEGGEGDENGEPVEAAVIEPMPTEAAAPEIVTAAAEEPSPAEDAPPAAKKPRRTRRAAAVVAEPDLVAPETVAEAALRAPRRRRKPAAEPAPVSEPVAETPAPVDVPVEVPVVAVEAVPELVAVEPVAPAETPVQSQPPERQPAEPAEPAGPPRRGWWNRFMQ
jgi:ribonuclease E